MVKGAGADKQGTELAQAKRRLKGESSLQYLEEVTMKVEAGS